MHQESSFRYKLAALVLVLALIVPVLAACGDDDEATTPVKTTPATTTPAATTPVATTPTAITTPTATAIPAATQNLGPIKIGILEDWSGPGAGAGWLADGVLGLMKWQLEKEGGLLVSGIRRPVEF
ncbi:MAG: hypothetical protein WC749_14160, partial [Dehalococcoidia bacterium]